MNSTSQPVLELEAVFNEAAFPEYTYVDPKEYPFIKSALRAKGKHVTISGASGSGKDNRSQQGSEGLGNTAHRHLASQWP